MGRPDWEVYPPAQDGAYAVVMLKRARLGGRLFTVGQIVEIRGGRHLRVAAHLCRTGQARPADKRTATDVELLLALGQVAVSVPNGGQSGEQCQNAAQRKDWRGS